MGQTNYLKLGAFVLYIALSVVSCWATAESLKLLFASLPFFLSIIITIGLFVVASFGFTMMINSLNPNLYIENRNLKFWVGLPLFIVFWLFCSMPTNTHTFFYRNVVDGEINGDITNTSGYLFQLQNNTNAQALLQKKLTKLDNDVEAKLGEFKSEVFNFTNPGLGPVAKQRLAEFAPILGVDRIEELNIGAGANKQQIYDAYRGKILALKDSRAEILKQQASNPDEQHYMKVAGKNLQDLEAVSKALDDEKLDPNKPDHVKIINRALLSGYGTIKTYNEHVEFKEGDKEIYTASNPVTKLQRLLSVVDVWKDYLTTDKYKGHGFFYWILLSVLVDIAAFVCCFLAFKKEY